MAGSLNKVQLIGRLGADPEIKQMVNGKNVARLSLATSQSWKDKTSGERKEKTEWHRIVIFNEGLVSVVQQYLKKGANVYIEGKSGTGKTTLTDLITGLLTKNAGKLVYSKNGQVIKLEQITFSYCSQTPIIFDDDLIKLRENINKKKELNDAVDLNFLKGKTEIYTGNLSGGERQRIGIARALTSPSSIYIFDEPTASLDEVNAAKLITKLKSFSRSHLVVVVTHDPRMISEGDNILNLN